MNGSELSVWHLIASADPIVKAIMFILLLASIWSWAVIVQHVLALKGAKREMKGFLGQFWSSKDMGSLYKKIKQHSADHGLSGIFQAGFRSFLKFNQGGSDKANAVVESVERAMRIAYMRESRRLSHGLSILATIGSVSPYIGLFGTVWGIMGSFKALGGVQQATLSMVAPGISEALIATAMGLFAAIPAVVAYNRLTASSEYLFDEYENFQDEFSGILARELHQR